MIRLPGIMSVKSAFLSEKASDAEGKKMDQPTLDRLPEEETPEVRLRTEIKSLLSQDDDYVLAAFDRKVQE